MTTHLAPNVKCVLGENLYSALFVINVTGTAEDYRLLERMNQSTLEKYSEMKEIASHVRKSMVDLEKKCKKINCLICYVKTILNLTGT